MTVGEIYDIVSRRLERDASERTYLAYLHETMMELRATVPQKYLWLNGTAPPPDEITPDEVWCNSLFHPAIIENILYLFTGEERYKNEFVRLCERAENMASKTDGSITITRKFAW